MDWSVYIHIIVFFLFAAMCGFFLGFFLMDSRWKVAFFRKIQKNGDISELPQDDNFMHHQQLETLGQLSAGIAHDFNNILSIIAGYVVLLEKNPGKEKYQEYIQSILTMTEKGAKLTRQMLAFGSQKTIGGESCELNETLKKQFVMVKPLMGEDIVVNLNLKKSPLWINADEQSIWQIMMNIATNARDAMNGKGEFTIETGETEQGNVFLSMSDTGAGMSRETQKRAFDPFFTTKDAGKGTGLGLSMVYGIVSQLGGKVSIQSEMGKGTAIRIELHPETMKQGAMRSVLNKDRVVCVAGNPLKNKTIMVVDDEPQLSMVLKAMLEQLDMNVIQASSGNEALAIQDDYEGNIDFLLSDVVMPEMNGDKLVDLFTSIRRETNMMLMTGYPMDREEKSKTLALPNNVPLLQKPFTAEELKAKLQEIYCGACYPDEVVIAG